MSNTLTRNCFGPVKRADAYSAIDSERDFQDSFVLGTIADGGRGYYPTHTRGVHPDDRPVCRRSAHELDTS